MTNSNKSERFLVVRTDFLGDSILSNTFIRMLSSLPGIRIDILCFEYNFAAFQYNPEVANKYFLYKTPVSSPQIDHNNKILSELKQNSYTATFMLNRDLKSYALLKNITTQKIFGHRLGVKSLRSKIFCRVTELGGKYNYLAYDNAIHEVINQFNLLKFALNKLNIKLPLVLDRNCYFYTGHFNPNQIGHRDETTVVVNISGRRDTVRYIPSSLARCIIEDLLKSGKKVLLIATMDEVERACELLAQFSGESIELCSETDLFKVADAMSGCLYYIGADGGLLHIAAGLQMCCVGLFHAQNITAWHPWSTTQVCVQTETKKIYDLTAKQIINALQQLSSNRLGFQ